MHAHYEYAWAQGHGVALDDLVNVEVDLWPYSKPKHCAPTSQPLDRFPVRQTNMAGFEIGDGRIDHAWQFVMTDVVLAYILQTRFSLVDATYDMATIYTHRHELSAYARYSCYITQPQPGRDLEHIRQGVFRVTFRFSDLQAL